MVTACLTVQHMPTAELMRFSVLSQSFHGINAEQWYGYNKSNGYYKYGQTPKVGAIACWSYNGGGGHVAVVEKVENGQVTFSNSAWSGQNFYLSYASTSDKNAGGNSWWNFQGYIYLGDFSGSTSTTQATPKR